MGRARFSDVAEEPLIHARGLVKRFGEFVAVNGIDVDVHAGESFGFLGPNGAGKSSTMRMVGCVSPPSGGTLRIRVAMDGDTLLLSCRDQGRGIGREEQRRVFEPFLSGTPIGTGLGLAIVYRIIREHNGDITLRSIPGQGTEVVVRLPLVSMGATA